ncbi:MAG: hypothetical protein ACKO0M_06835 [Cyanobium sp.]
MDRFHGKAIRFEQGDACFSGKPAQMGAIEKPLILAKKISCRQPCLHAPMLSIGQAGNDASIMIKACA